MRDDGRYVLFICEGSAERAILENLMEAGKLGIPVQRIVEDPETGDLYTMKRGPSSIAEAFLNLDYGGCSLRIVRILDSKKERFGLPRGYESRATVETLLTRPEIEILVILRERAYDRWRRSGKKSSDFCKTDLHMRRIKSFEYIKRYWSNTESLISAIAEYDRIRHFDRGELSLSELLR